MDKDKIDELINCFKRIVRDNPRFRIPELGAYDSLDLKSSNFLFIVDVNRKGRKKPQFTLQLRQKQAKDSRLLRLDLIGPAHPNPDGDFPYAGEIIPCPHLHIAHPEYGISIAYPLNSDYAKIYLKEEELSDLVLILRKFLERCNVGNINDYYFEHQTEII